jgi:hypothetical protein
MDAPGQSAAPPASWRTRLAADWSVVWPWLVVARLAVLAGWLLAGAARAGTQPTMRLRGEGLLAWDGTWYRDIAVLGYGALPDEALRFFPVYPLVARALAWPLGVDATTVSWALVVVANVAAVAAAVLVRRLVLADGGSVAMANRAAVALTVFPTAFVLVWGYSEALFLVAAIGVMYAVRTDRYGLAVLAGLVAGGTRPLGVFLALAVAVEVVRTWRSAGGTARVLRLAAVAAPVAGAAVWLAWASGRTNDWLYPFSGQTELRGEAVNPVVRLVQAVGELFGPEMFGDGLHLPFAVAFVVLTVVVARTQAASYTVFTVAVLVTALSADNLNSLERYALNAFPVVVAVAAVCTTAWRSRVAVVVGVAGMVSLSALAWTGTYVP